jgi:imidazolonepropionase-like amidohydrolase
VAELVRYLGFDRLIDGTGTLPIGGAIVAVQGELIVWVGQRSELPPAESSVVIEEFADSTCLPGLIDAHAHFSLPADGRSYEEVARDSDEMMAIVGGRNLGTHLRAGITSARDNGARNALGFVLKKALERGLIEGPRLLACGRPIVSSGGHFGWCNGTADGEGEIRRAVRLLVSEGADHIKLMASGGGTVGSDPRRASYTSAELLAAVEAAHDLGRLTTGHCRAREGMVRALESGVDCMEHAEFIDHDGESRFDSKVADSLLESGIFVCPTLQVGWDSLLRLRQRASEEGLDDAGRRQLADQERAMGIKLENFNKLLEIGLGPRMILGTDAGCFDFRFGHADYGMNLMIAGGMAPMQAIMAATNVAATACGISETVGTVQPGKLADIVIVSGNPLDDMNAISRVMAVYKGGNLVHRNDPLLTEM